jgi:hypothetical protein
MGTCYAIAICLQAGVGQWHDSSSRLPKISPKKSLFFVARLCDQHRGLCQP